MIVAVIPARFAATRLPGKPLVDLNGQTMIERVWRATQGASSISKVIVATDDQRIVDEVHRFGGEVVLTDPELPSGTDRCFAAVQQLGMVPSIVINVQGDEPLLQPHILDDLVRGLETSDADVATPVQKISDVNELSDPSVVKVVMNQDRMALFFSRSPIPYVRSADQNQWLLHHTFWKHIGVYAYRFDALIKHVQLPPSKLEISESLEQLRSLEQGSRFLCVETNVVLKSVDTPDDVERVRELLRTI